MSFYVATLVVLVAVRFPFVQWMGLISVSVATIATVAICEHGRWNLGLFVRPLLAVREFLFGSVFGFLLISACALLIVLTTGIRHEPGGGFPWFELATIFVPAVVHEELLFRGYAFQKLHRWRRGFAILFVAFVFAALHAGNTSVTLLGLANVFLGGVLLGLAYERYERLWYPIGLHLAWNLTSGPFLGHEVSGYESMNTILVERGSGPDLLTGGEFGIEGSIWMTAVECIAIILLVLAVRRRSRSS
ncbi:MAG: CPBP family intramembrane glutamic endopeptidase, partial [Thermoanaerobaculia bacterium]